ncbi:MAG TPA: MauE/DoxX family redox-associated membrane protein [Acidimicrobiales bacterium]|nr:MauE/DoxX family redox-associated membrane protein [Acidimicrobiales bacterium]
MPTLTGPALTAALLLVFAGATKAVDPAMTAGALRALGLPSSKILVRLGAAAELLLGLLAVIAGWVAVWWLVAASYLAFAAFVVAALRAGTMLGSCGCFGREDTPPHPLHVVIDVALAATAAAAAVRDVGAPLDAIADAPGEGLLVGGLSVLAVVVLYAAFVDLPRALRQPRRS